MIGFAGKLEHCLYELELYLGLVQDDCESVFLRFYIADRSTLILVEGLGQFPGLHLCLAKLTKKINSRL